MQVLFIWCTKFRVGNNLRNWFGETQENVTSKERKKEADTE